MKWFLYVIFIFLSIQFSNFAQSKNRVEIPAVYSDNIKFDSESKLYVDLDTIKVYEVNKPVRYTLEKMIGNPKGTETGIAFDFKIPDLDGTLYYGFIDYFDSKHPQPVYYWDIARIDSGKASINIKNRLSEKFDMVGWQKSGKGTIGYRISNKKGQLIYDGIISFVYADSFKIDDTITEGPFVNIVTDHTAIISFETHRKIICGVSINGQTFKDEVASQHHEIDINGLNSDTQYPYSVFYGGNQQTYSLKTAPSPASRKPFTFAYASDSRAGKGGGERNIYGTNFYMMKKILALVLQQKASFMQFTGDLVNGYVTDIDDIALQYANWRRAVEPFAHYFPIYSTMGNHEAIKRMFINTPHKIRIDIERFPFDSESAEAVYARNFVNPLNGPASEDGMSYDPDLNKVDFPSYKENVYYYSYDNVAMIVLNSNYWYIPSTHHIPITGGNPHSYIMDKQLDWLGRTIQSFENNDSIDHIFVTVHTPFFPNGGHINKDMWYSGKNDVRPYVAGVPLKKGIIERRDELLNILVNKSSKVRAILTGDEHNYNRLEIGPDTNIYPDNWELKKMSLNRTIYQINNGAAGAPYYAQEKTPWTPFVSGFTTQNAVVFFHVKGNSIVMKVLNPDTLEEVDYFELH